MTISDIEILHVKWKNHSLDWLYRGTANEVKRWVWFHCRPFYLCKTHRGLTKSSIFNVKWKTNSWKHEILS